MVIAIDYPRLGPLLATSFDRAVRLTLQSWIWLVVITALVVTAAIYRLQQPMLNLGLIVWSFAAAANAVRTLRPDYKMSGGTIGRLLLASFATGIATVFATFALVWPGIYVATKFSMTQAAIVLDDLPAEVGISRSWQITNDRFWRTLLFAIVVALAVLVTETFPALLAGIVAGVLVTAHLVPLPMDQATELAAALITPVAMYAVQANWIAGLYWYHGLKAMHEAQAVALAPAASG